MPIDTDVVKDALDNFENDEYVKAKDLLRKEIRKAKNEYLTKELGLEKYSTIGGNEEEVIDDDEIDNDGDE